MRPTFCAKLSARQFLFSAAFRDNVRLCAAPPEHGGPARRPRPV